MLFKVQQIQIIVCFRYLKSYTKNFFFRFGYSIIYIEAYHFVNYYKLTIELTSLYNLNISIRF